MSIINATLNDFAIYCKERFPKDTGTADSYLISVKYACEYLKNDLDIESKINNFLSDCKNKELFKSKHFAFLEKYPPSYFEGGFLQRGLQCFLDYINDPKETEVIISTRDEALNTVSPAKAFALQDFKEVLHKTGYVIDDSLVERYVCSLLAKPFVILTGNSGIGKTKIALLFAQYLAKSTESGKENANCLIVPVGSDWTDTRNIVGFYNPITETYQSTEILKLILSATKNPSIPYFLILDEMNLSHVERYFSDFLSALESGEAIPLHGSIKIQETDGIPPGIKIPENLFITGTVNIDETTYMFSPKVLDRTNVIEFSLSSENIKNFLDNETISVAKISIGENGIAEGFLKAYSDIQLSSRIEDESASNRTSEVISTLFDKESSNANNFEFGYRAVKEIKRYINAAYKLGNNNIDNILDVQILQKILPKIHGNRRKLGSLLKDLKDYCDTQQFSLSSSKINDMLHMLDTDQFASYIR